MSNLRRIFILSSILLFLLLFDVLGYILIESAPFSDALYMTVISITTVGYKEVFELSSNGRLFTVWVIVSGLGTFFYIAGKLAESMVEGNLRRILGRRKMKSIAKMKDHVIIAGFGVMGEHVCRGLAKSKTKFVSLENDIERFVSSEEKGYHTLMGDATDEEMLKQAGIEQARSFVCLLSTDANNIITVMTARELNPSLFIISRAVESSNKNKLHKVGANRVITPYELSSQRIVNTVLRPNVVEFLEVMSYAPNMSLSIEEITVHETSEFTGKQIKDSGLRENYNIIIIGVKREEDMFFNPSPTMEILAGDILILVGEKDKLLSIN